MADLSQEIIKLQKAVNQALQEFYANTGTSIDEVRAERKNFIVPLAEARNPKHSFKPRYSIEVKFQSFL